MCSKLVTDNITKLVEVVVVSLVLTKNIQYIKLLLL